MKRSELFRSTSTAKQRPIISNSTATESAVSSKNACACVLLSRGDAWGTKPMMLNCALFKGPANRSFRRCAVASSRRSMARRAPVATACLTSRHSLSTWQTMRISGDRTPKWRSTFVAKYSSAGFEEAFTANAPAFVAMKTTPSEPSDDAAAAKVVFQRGSFKGPAGKLQISTPTIFCFASSSCCRLALQSGLAFAWAVPALGGGGFTGPLPFPLPPPLPPLPPLPPFLPFPRKLPRECMPLNCSSSGETSKPVFCMTRTTSFALRVSLGDKNVNAKPFSPARAVRPMRCT
mmetsp:Transcript_40058/g.74240  ORF Transcript_40058/g.74240 Transcript_40058/m.74240 type:complete len:291 (+) Transcript_40058:2104-2976(+)